MLAECSSAFRHISRQEVSRRASKWKEVASMTWDSSISFNPDLDFFVSPDDMPHAEVVNT